MWCVLSIVYHGDQCRLDIINVSIQFLMILITRAADFND